METLYTEQSWYRLTCNIAGMLLYESIYLHKYYVDIRQYIFTYILYNL